MNIQYRLFITSCIIILLYSCSQKNNDLSYILNLAGDNRHELEKVLIYYKHDKLKYKAAVFLISNMKNKYSIIPNDTVQSKIIMNDICNIKDSIGWEVQYSKVYQYFDSTDVYYSYLSNQCVYDINTITSEYLINNIELAFDSWIKIKDKYNYSFDDFCNYVLPYRVGTEPLTDWRNEILNEYGHFLDSTLSIKELASQILENSKINYNIGMSKYPYQLTYSQINKIKYGSCEHLTQYLTYILRSLGIPCAIDFVPNWANRSSSHQWNVVINNKGKPIEIGFGPNLENEIIYKIPKIYRYTYQNISHNFKDVTKEYGMPVYNLKLQLNKEFDQKFFQLCVFDNRSWVPVDEAQAKNGFLCFEDIGMGKLFGNNKIKEYSNEGKGIVYLPAITGLLGFHYPLCPIILYENGEIEKLCPNMNNLIEVVLDRKYPRYNYIVEYDKNMLNGYFEASNNRDFKNAQILHVITTLTYNGLSTVDILPPQRFRYIRYVSPDSSYINIGELAFYNKDERLSGEILASCSNKNNSFYAFDHKIESYYSSKKKGGYIGLDLKLQTPITKIAYSPRTDNNNIVLGNLYELYYWDKGWKSLGKQTACTYKLLYQNVPSNSLLLLRNLSEGIEERIFTYDNNKQIWW